MLQHSSSALLVKLAVLRDRFSRDREGVTAVEYGLLAALIAVVIIGGVTAFGGSLNAFFNGLAAKLKI
ncbi:Flp family type IVb pilin [Roseomonas nepalensis]|uniref:Flp family type IVb pilin n=1 Tax=Muricoccus nepalensis TaxID=1854500 RepID=A0A502GDC7_9PROT|nr:Flp family type IVb pilin [Roseomonas nepalensis]TPG59751.1 Flp family type IVb pilin [Roseomonas nepalensis]